MNQDLGRTWQNSFGVARQFGSAMAVEADYIYSQGRHEKDIIGNTNRRRPDGTIVPRNSFTQPARRRLDVRVQQRISLGGRVAIDGIAEVFNTLNSPNWTITTQESNRQFGLRTSGENRTAQFGFRVTVQGGSGGRDST